MSRIIGQKCVSNEEILDILRNQLGQKCRQQLEEMLRNGIPIPDVIQYFLENGKTHEEEAEELRQKMEKLLSDGNLSPEQLLSQLDREAFNNRLHKI